MQKTKQKSISVLPADKEKTLEAFFQYGELSGVLFDRRKDEIYDVTDIPETNKFHKLAIEKAKELKINWKKMSHEESNRIMLALLEDSFNLIREIENSKSIILETKLIIKK